MKLIDAHEHFSRSLNTEKYNSILHCGGIDCYVMQCIPQQGLISTVPDALYQKQLFPENTRVMGGLERAAYFRYKGMPNKLGAELVSQVKQLISAGCDGIKLLEGKPDIRRNYPIPDFDEESWEPFWKYMEDEQLPITMHVNDPPDFWDKSKINPYALSRGWFYGPETINNEVQYAQMEHVFQKHPALKITLAHFFFMSRSLSRLSKLMESCPNLRVDLTPGIEIYYDFSNAHEQSLDFFNTYSDRILFGTDIGSRAVIRKEMPEIDPNESLPRIHIVKDMLERDDHYLLEPDGSYLYGIPTAQMHGLGLSKEVLEKIYQKNAEAVWSNPSQTVDPAAIINWINYCIHLLQASSTDGKEFSEAAHQMESKTAWFENPENKQ